MRLIVEKNRTRQVSLHDASEGTGLADDEAALFSNVKAEIFKSSPNDGTRFSPYLFYQYKSPVANSPASHPTTSL